MKNKILSTLTLITLVMVSFVGVAFAQAAASGSEDDILDMISVVADAFLGGEYWMGASLLLVLAVSAASRWGSLLWKPLESAPAKVVLVFLGAFGAAFGASAAFTGAAAFAALKVAIGAAGGYSIVKVALEWALSKFESKLPASVVAILSVVLKLLDHKNKVIAKAEAAGDAAVKENPGQGLDGELGNPNILE